MTVEIARAEACIYRVVWKGSCVLTERPIKNGSMAITSPPARNWTRCNNTVKITFTARAQSMELDPKLTCRARSSIHSRSKYPPAEPGALDYEPLEAAVGVADTAPARMGHLKVVQGTRENSNSRRDPISAAERMRIYRTRRRNGQRCVQVLLHETEIDELVRKGFLRPQRRHDQLLSSVRWVRSCATHWVRGPLGGRAQGVTRNPDWGTRAFATCLRPPSRRYM